MPREGQATAMVNGSQIYKATYSGIPVYEMVCKNVAVMRRRSDDWMNATQILKIAEFDKPQRTRILEKSIQVGEHEKVQGGYGKYQGTWIPLERGRQVAAEFGVSKLLSPIFDYQPTAQSPPLAPKHIVAAPKSRKTASAASTPKAMPATPVAAARTVPGPSHMVGAMPMPPLGALAHQLVEDSAFGLPAADDSSSSEVDMSLPEGDMTSDEDELESASNMSEYRQPVLATPQPQTVAQARKRKRAEKLSDDMSTAQSFSDPAQPKELGLDGEDPSEYYSEVMLDYFVSDSQQIPGILVDPPADYNPNAPIDEEGHTALHWACAMGRTKIVRKLIELNADIKAQNNQGQTALMRSVMFTNNYDQRKFPELLELLESTIWHTDRYDQTVGHHIASTAMSKGKSTAARYYMDTLIVRFSAYPEDLVQLLNTQDEEGDTPLTIAARSRNKKLIKMLLEVGVDPKVKNNDDHTAEDYILEDEKWRAGMRRSITPPEIAPTVYAAGYPPKPHLSEAGQRASKEVIPAMAELLENLATSYDKELEDKERDLAQANTLWTNIQAEVTESLRLSNNLKKEAESVEAMQHQILIYQINLKRKLQKKHRLGWERYARTQEEKQRQNAKSATFDIHEYQMTGDHTAPGFLSFDPEALDASAHQLPTDPLLIHQESEHLRHYILQAKDIRSKIFDEIISRRTDSGTSKKQQEYRKLIAICCGIGLEDVDAMLPGLVEAIEAEDL